jgi:hypothetical protein
MSASKVKNRKLDDTGSVFQLNAENVETVSTTGYCRKNKKETEVTGRRGRRRRKLLNDLRKGADTLI